MTPKAQVVFEKLAKKLTTEAREHISKKNFAEPKEKAYPIEDKAHARNALARVSQHGSSAEKAKVRAKVHAKYPDIGEKTAAHKSKKFSDYFNTNPLGVGAAMIGVQAPLIYQNVRNLKDENKYLRGLSMGALALQGASVPLIAAKSIQKHMQLKKKAEAILAKLAKKDMPHFEDQDRPEKAKEVFHALKEEHPEYSAGKKARIANAVAAGTVKH